MNGDKLLVDTNILLYLLAGDETLSTLLEGRSVHLSFISELELYAFRDLDPDEKGAIDEMIKQCTVIDINQPIKKRTVGLRRQKGLKLPDSIIAASAIYLDIPFISADRAFDKLEELNFVLYEP